VEPELALWPLTARRLAVCPGYGGPMGPAIYTLPATTTRGIAYRRLRTVQAHRETGSPQAGKAMLIGDRAVRGADLPLK
jgi:hypothetical protein